MTSGIVLDVTGSQSTQVALPAAESFSVANLPPGTYSVSVRGTNAFGASLPSNSMTLSVPGPCSGPPLAPDGLQVYKVGSQVYVYWLPAAIGPASTGYVLNVTGSFNGSLPTSARTLSGSVGPGTYNLSVAATNPCGQGPSSAVQTVSVP